MRVGLMLPTLFSVSSPVNGVLVLAEATRSALQSCPDVEVVALNPWEHALEGLDLIHAFGGPEGYSGGRLETGVPWVLTPVHDSLQPRWKYRAAVRVGSLHPRLRTIPAEKSILYRSVDRLTVLSSDEATRISQSCDVPIDRISVVHAAVSEPPSIDPDAAMQFLALHDVGDDYCLAVCDYSSRRKNIERLILACQNAGLPLVLAGRVRQTPVLTSIEKLARKGEVKLLGFVDGAVADALMARCRVYCQPSIEEGAGMAAMRAALHGAPILATDVGGAAEHLGPYARYVDPFDVRSIAGGLSDLWFREGVVPSVGDWIRQNRTWSHSVAELLNAYRLALRAVC